MPVSSPQSPVPSKSLLTALVALALVAAACAGTATAPRTTADVPAATTAPGTTAGAGAATTTGAEPAQTTADSTAAPTTLPAVPLSSIRVDVEPVSDGFEQPVFAAARPGDDRLFVIDQPGRLYAVDLDSGRRDLILDITDRVRFSGEQGLLGLAFHPTDPERMFVHYSARDGATTLVEHRLGFDGAAEPGSERLVFGHPQPAGNHNGGMIAFGPDGYLYVALGDGGGADDQFGNGQDPHSLLGTILRLDVDSATPYAIPADNPFADGIEGAPEVWAWGLRNPWRFSFDGDDVWVADVGQATWEEVDLLDARTPGSNAGWSVLEGTHCFRSDPCESDPYVAPVFEYRHDGGRCSISGGVVYRGSAVPELTGAYLFGDWCSGEVWGLRPGDATEVAVLTDVEDVFLPALPGLTSFGTGPDGEVYITQMGAGIVWRLVAG